MTLKEKVINGIIEREGGYVNNPNDPGGETNWGITVAVARKWGYTGAMKDLPREVAFQIYSKLYWDSVNLDEVSKLSETIAEKVADIGVNLGTHRAAEFLQRSLNVLNREGKLYSDLKVDDDIGASTIKALTSYLNVRKDDGGEIVLFRALNCLQGSYYITLSERREKNEEFTFGWLKNRVS